MKEIRISEVLELIETYHNREEIAEHFGINMSECKQLFQHPELKGKRTRPKPTFVIVDDVSDNQVDLEDMIEEVESELPVEEAQAERAEIDVEQEQAQQEEENIESSGTEDIPAVEPIFPLREASTDTSTEEIPSGDVDNFPNWNN